MIQQLNISKDIEIPSVGKKAPYFMNNNIYFLSDVHAYHSNIIKFCNRPYSTVEEMNISLIKNINDMVGENDELWLLGDTVFGKLQNWIDFRCQINCKNIYKIKGNHDAKNYTETKLNEVKSLFKGWYDYKEISRNKQFMILHHYPHFSWNEMSSGSWNIFGHCHHNIKDKEHFKNNKMIDVGADTWYTELGMTKPEYKPYSFEQIKTYMDTKNITIPDHH